MTRTMFHIDGSLSCQPESNLTQYDMLPIWRIDPMSSYSVHTSCFFGAFNEGFAFFSSTYVCEYHHDWKSRTFHEVHLILSHDGIVVLDCDVTFSKESKKIGFQVLISFWTCKLKWKSSDLLSLFYPWSKALSTPPTIRSGVELSQITTVLWTWIWTWNSGSFLAEWGWYVQLYVKSDLPSQEYKCQVSIKLQ